MCIATFESSPDMSILATGSNDGSVALWSCMKGANPEDFQVKKLWERRLHSEMVIGMSFSDFIFDIGEVWEQLGGHRKATKGRGQP